MNIIIDKLKENLISTRNFMQKNPNALYPYNYNNILQMLDYAIKNWDDEKLRLFALKNLADKEIEIKAKGLSNDNESENDEGYFDSIYETLLENTQLIGISGWGDLKKWLKKEKDKRVIKREERKKKRIERKIETKKNGSHLFNTINRLNPATVAARNALRVLISLNIFGIASILNSQKAKQRGVYAKAEKLYFNIGGVKSVWDKSVKTGASKNPFLSKKIRERLAKGELKGLGLDPATDSLLAVAGGFILTIMKWIKDAGLNKDNDTENSSTKTISNSNNNFTKQLDDVLKYKEDVLVNNTVEKNYPQTKPKFVPSKPKQVTPILKTFISNSNPYNPPTIYDDERKKKKTKIIVGTLGAVGVGTVVYYFLNRNKLSRPKLSGIKIS